MSKRKVLSVSEKVEIIKLLDQGERNVAVCKQYGLSSSTVSTLMKNKEALMKAYEANVTNCKRLKKCEKDDLDKALLKWVIQQQNSCVPITGPIIKTQAEKFAAQLSYPDFSCSNGWLYRFKQRHNISAGNVIKQSFTVKDEHEADWLNTLKNLCKNYAEDDIYNAEEAGIFYNLTPYQTTQFKEETCTDGELLQNRLTVLLCCNVSGTDKRKLFVVGKYETPQCFKGIKCLPVTYKSNKKAWMTSELFSSYLYEWEKELYKQKRKIALVVENCAAHSHVNNLKNIKLVFLPLRNSVLHPLYLGVIRSFKCQYRKQLILTMLNQMEKDQDLEISIIKAIHLMTDAWASVPQLCIQNCYREAGWIERKDDDFDNQEDLPLSVWLKQMNINQFNNVLNIDEYISVDDDIETSGILSAEDIVAEVIQAKECEKADNKDLEEEIEFKMPTYACASESLQNLEHFFERMENTDDAIFNALSVLRRKLNDTKFSWSQNFR